MERIDQLMEFLSLTKAIYQKARMVDADMEQNEAGQLEALQDLFDRRQQVIEALSEQPLPGWSGEERDLIEEIQELELDLQPVMKKLHAEFSAQMARLSQRKQASGKLAGAYRQSSAGGSFIDQRK